DHREFPKHWPRIGRLDFGYDHPAAAVELVWDRDTDTVYVSRTHRIRETSVVVFAAAIKPWGNLPWAWPRDGRRETLGGAGIALAKQYQVQGLESVRKHQAGLQSFRSMRRIEASRRNASALRLRFSQSLASLRQRLSQAKVRSTTQRRGSTTNPLVRSERLTIS